MNSTEDRQKDEVIMDGNDADTQFATPDTNANVSHVLGQVIARGAIPKTRPPVKTKSCPKKTVKINNNVEDIVSLNAGFKKNGAYSNGITNLGTIKDNTSPSEVYKSDEGAIGYAEANDSTNCTSCANGDEESSGTLCDRLKFDDIDSRSCRSGIIETNRLEPLANRDHLNLELDTSESSTEDDLLSISDDGCIYTYKGDQMADLPSSFFSLDIPLPEIPEPVDPNRQQSGSPEMDFLEMDFDPGPSGDGDSECGDFQNSDSFSSDKVQKLENSCESNKPSLRSENQAISNDLSLPGPSTINLTSASSSKTESPTAKRRDVLSKCEADLFNNSMPWCYKRELFNSRAKQCFFTSKKFHCQKGELISPNEKNFSEYSLKSSKSMYNFENEEEDSEWKKLFGNSMIWSEKEAPLRQFTQVGPSACGATAVLNALTALRIPIPPLDKLYEVVNTRLRANSSPLAEYLLSRSVAGTTHDDIIDGLHRLSDGKVFARFFPMYPERVFCLERWLAHWIREGAVPIATLNLQRCIGTIPDAWHHQMIFGVKPNGIFLTNPLECVEPCRIWPELCSESVLLVRREDVIQKWNLKTDLRQLAEITDNRWTDLNVVGQVANLMLEHKRKLRPGFINTTHIKIPAAYQSGITLAIRVEQTAYPVLRRCPDLPLLHPDNLAAALP